MQLRFQRVPLLCPLLKPHEGVPWPVPLHSGKPHARGVDGLRGPPESSGRSTKPVEFPIEWERGRRPVPASLVNEMFAVIPTPLVPRLARLAAHWASREVGGDVGAGADGHSDDCERRRTKASTVERIDDDGAGLRWSAPLTATDGAPTVRDEIVDGDDYEGEHYLLIDVLAHELGYAYGLEWTGARGRAMSTPEFCKAVVPTAAELGVLNAE